MLNKKYLRVVAALLIGFSYIPITISADYGAKVTKERFIKADVVIVQMNDIRASVFTFYDDNAALPGNMGLLIDPARIYYTGNKRSAFGSPFVGVISGDGRFFNVTVDLKSAEVANYVAQRLNTQPTGSSVTLSIGTPASSIVDNGFLTRNFDPARPLLNQMKTDFSLGGNNINDVDLITATRINVSDLATLEELQVIATTTTLDLVSTGTSSLNTVNISGNTTLNNTSINGSFSINGGVNVNSVAEFNDVANFNSAVKILELLSVKNGLKVINGIVTDTINGDAATFTNTNTTNLKSTGTATLNNVVATKLTTSAANVTGKLTTKESLVTGNQTVKGTAFINSLDVAGSAIIRSKLNVIGTTQLDGLIIAGNAMANGELTAALGVFLGNRNAHVGQSSLDDSLRFTNTAGWVDIGKDSSGVVTFDTDGNGYTFDHKVKATGSGGDIELNVSSGYPEIVFSRLGKDVTFGLTNPSSLVLAGADLKTTNRVFARELYENNVSLKNKYLLINGKAKDSDKLDGYTASDFAFANHQHQKLQGPGYQTINLNSRANSVPSGSLQVDQYSHASTGRPAATNNANSVLTIGQFSGGYTAQLAFSSDGNMYQRSNPYSSVGSWGKVWTSNNDGRNSGLDADKLGGYNHTQFHKKSEDILIAKSNAWLTLDSPSSGSSGFNQGAGFSIGESGKKGTNSLHLTYTGDGNSYIGMGSVSSSTGIPSNAVLKMKANSKNAWFQGEIFEKGVSLEEKYALKGDSSSWTLAYNGREDRDIFLPSQHNLAGKEVMYLGSDETNDDEISFVQMYIPEQSGFRGPRYFNNTWGKFEYYYSNNRVYVGGDTGFRKIWYRDPVDLPDVGVVRP
jgi:hypothetical protein